MTIKEYLSMADIAEAEGVDVATVSKWRDRFADFPAPDIRLGRRGQWPGWDESRLPEISAWRENRHGQGGRPRHITVDEAHAIGLPLAEWIAAGSTPTERTRRLERLHQATDQPAALAAILDAAKVQPPNQHVALVLTKPAGNQAGDYARGLVLTATLEHIAQFRPYPQFAVPTTEE
jgi:hypothetical protein